MAKFDPNPAERAALELLFETAEGFSGGSLRARKFLCAWWNGDELGGFDFADIWSMDQKHIKAMVAVFAMIARAPTGTYADSIEGFEERMRALAMRRVEERKLERD
jgi:hypothetical protein